MAFLRYHVTAISTISAKEIVNGFFTTSQLAYEVLSKLEKKYRNNFTAQVTPVYLTHLPKFDLNEDYEKKQRNIR